MARLPYPEPATLPERIRDTLDDLAPHNIYRMLATAPAQFPPFIQLGAANFLDLELSARLRELAILAVARETGANYEWAHHVPIALRSGIEDGEIDAINRRDATALPPVEQDVVAFAVAVTRDVRATDDVFAAVRGHLGDRQTAELLLVVGYYNMVSRFLENMQVDIEPKYYARLA